MAGGHGDAAEIIGLKHTVAPTTGEEVAQRLLRPSQAPDALEVRAPPAIFVVYDEATGRLPSARGRRMNDIAGIERRTKIVCTIGPATSSRAQLLALLERGMNVARLRRVRPQEAIAAPGSQSWPRLVRCRSSPALVLAQVKRWGCKVFAKAQGRLGSYVALPRGAGRVGRSRDSGVPMPRP